MLLLLRGPAHASYGSMSDDAEIRGRSGRIPNRGRKKTTRDRCQIGKKQLVVPGDYIESPQFHGELNSPLQYNVTAAAVYQSE